MKRQLRRNMKGRRAVSLTLILCMLAGMLGGYFPGEVKAAGPVRFSMQLEVQEYGEPTGKTYQLPRSLSSYGINVSQLSWYGMSDRSETFSAGMPTLTDTTLYVMSYQTGTATFNWCTYDSQDIVLSIDVTVIDPNAIDKQRKWEQTKISSSQIGTTYPFAEKMMFMDIALIQGDNRHVLLEPGFTKIGANYHRLNVGVTNEGIVTMPEYINYDYGDANDGWTDTVLRLQGVKVGQTTFMMLEGNTIVLLANVTVVGSGQTANRTVHPQNAAAVRKISLKPGSSYSQVGWNGMVWMPDAYNANDSGIVKVSTGGGPSFYVYDSITAVKQGTQTATIAYETTSGGSESTYDWVQYQVTVGNKNAPPEDGGTVNAEPEPEPEVDPYPGADRMSETIGVGQTRKLRITPTFADRIGELEYKGIGLSGDQKNVDILDWGNDFILMKGLQAGEETLVFEEDWDNSGYKLVLTVTVIDYGSNPPPDEIWEDKAELPVVNHIVESSAYCGNIETKTIPLPQSISSFGYKNYEIDAGCMVENFEIVSYGDTYVEVKGFKEGTDDVVFSVGGFDIGWVPFMKIHITVGPRDDSGGGSSGSSEEIGQNTSTSGGSATNAVAKRKKAVALSKTSLSLVKGKAATITLNNAKGKINWKSKNKKIAVVNSTGKVTGKAIGNTLVTATYNKKTYTCKVAVIGPEQALSKTSLNLEKGKSTTLKLGKISGSKVTWKSSDAASVTVTKAGKITAKAFGGAVISAAYQNRTYKCAVRVPLSKKPVSGTAGPDKAVSIGTIDANGYQLSLPKGSFEENTKVTAKTDGETISITADGKNDVRLQEPVTIRIKISEKAAPSKTYLYRAAYKYNGTTYYYDPDEEQLKKGYLVFQTYHFSDYEAQKLSVKKAVRDICEKEAKEKSAYFYTQEKNADEINKSVDEVMKKLYPGMDGESLKERAASVDRLTKKSATYKALKILQTDQTRGMRKLATAAIMDTAYNYSMDSILKRDWWKEGVENKDALIRIAQKRKNGQELTIEELEILNKSLPPINKAINEGKYEKAAELLAEEMQDSLKNLLATMKASGNTVINGVGSVFMEEAAEAVIYGKSNGNRFMAIDSSLDIERNDEWEEFKREMGILPYQKYVNARLEEYRKEMLAQDDAGPESSQYRESVFYGQDHSREIAMIDADLRSYLIARKKTYQKAMEEADQKAKIAESFADAGLFGTDTDLNEKDLQKKLEDYLWIREKIEGMFEGESPAKREGYTSKDFEDVNNRRYAELVKKWVDNSEDGDILGGAYDVELYLAKTYGIGLYCAAEKYKANIGENVKWKLYMGLHEMKASSWSTSDKKTATITSEGISKGTGDGKATISAKYGGGTGSNRILIGEGPLHLNYDKYAMASGGSASFRLLTEQNYDVAGNPKWSQNKGGIANFKVYGKEFYMTDAKAGTVTVTANYNGRNYTCKVTVNGNVKLDKTSMTLGVDQKEQLYLSDAAPNLIEWGTDKPEICSVSKNGVVTAKKKGSATVYAMYEGKTYKCKLKVVANPNIKLSQTSLTLYKGESSRIRLIDATAKSVKWASKNKKIATVSDGLIKAVKAGTTTITASYKGETYKCKVTVKNKTYRLNKTKLTLTVGGSAKLTLVGAPAGKVTWSTANNTIATVSGGTVKAKKAGTTTITAKYGGKSYKCSVTVKKKPSLGGEYTGTITWHRVENDECLWITSGELFAGRDGSLSTTVDVTKIEGGYHITYFGNVLGKTSGGKFTANDSTTTCSLTASDITISWKAEDGCWKTFTGKKK